MTTDRRETTPALTPAGRAGVPWVAVVTFVVLACGLAWLAVLPLWLGEGLASPLATVFITLMMVTPALATVIVMGVFRTPGAPRARALGMAPLRPLGRFFLFLGIGLIAPIVVVVATIAVSAAFGLVELDLVEFSGFAAQISSASAGAPLPPIIVLVIVQIVAIPVGALVNSVLAFGEELGWRGWLHGALLPLGAWPTVLITGAVWGLWHAPVILLGYNFARPDGTGLAFMVGGCVAWGVLLGWLRLRSASLWPAVLAHGSLNAVGGLILVFVAVGETPDLAVVGPLGLVAWAIIAVMVVVIVAARQFRSGVVAPATSEAPR
ncbi:CPBP family intramembrane glutamic endopeptidase [Microbacterium koreense]|uniref:CPBP family intramembrane glutamic endopeptidase n=1 Tax=Microbacterium koreense TaxID=323761 RepID=A0ABW2ZR87_9MICO